MVTFSVLQSFILGHNLVDEARFFQLILILFKKKKKLKKKNITSNIIV